MSELDFIKTNAAEIYNEVITELEKGVSEALYPGDERRIFGEALAALFVGMYNAVNDAARQKMLRYARDDVLDALGENRSVIRYEPVPATTTLRFSVEAALRNNVVIQTGTRVTGDYLRYFATTKTVVLAAGDTYVDVEAASVGGGESFNNIPVGELNTIVDLVAYISKVKNTTPTTGGSDKESDEAYRDRIRSAPDSLSTAGPANMYRYWAISADATIADAAIESPEPGVVVITPIGYGGIVPDEALLDKVLKKCAADDIRVLTDLVLVQAPSILQYDIELVYYTTPGSESGVVQMVEGSGGAIDRFIYWQGSALNRDLNPDYLHRLILAPDWAEGLTGADFVEITSPVYTQLNATTVAKFSGNLRVSHIVRGR